MCEMEIKVSGMPGREKKEKCAGWVEQRQINRSNEKRGGDRRA